MTQKACEGGFRHVTVFAFIFEMPQNRRISISVVFSVWIPCHVPFPRNAPLSIVRGISKSSSNLKWEKHVTRYSNRPKLKSLTQTSSTCFLGHFIVSPVLTLHICAYLALIRKSVLTQLCRYSSNFGVFRNCTNVLDPSFHENWKFFKKLLSEKWINVWRGRHV